MKAPKGKTLIIAARFCGPPESGNGGYVCGLLAQRLGGKAVEVTLRAPPPLERPLQVEPLEDGVRLLDGGRLLAEARPLELELEVPKPPSLKNTEMAVTRYLGFENHPFPSCFVCGPQRAPGDGLRVFAGPLTDGTGVAAPWVPERQLTDDAGWVKPEFLWATLDCPGFFAVVGEHVRPLLLGRLTVRLLSRIRPRQPYLVMGWKIGREGRKHLAGTALFTIPGKLVGMARAVWIEPRSSGAPAPS